MAFSEIFVAVPNVRKMGKTLSKLPQIYRSAGGCIVLMIKSALANTS